MYRKYFPKCTVEGDLTPAPYGAMLSKGSIPKKCSECEFIFEGECLRAAEIMDGYMELDHGSCSKAGPTHPFEIQNKKNETLFIPAKCQSCELLNENWFGLFECLENSDVWGDFKRSLDWGDWEPDYPMVGINGITITRELILAIQEGKEAKAIKIYRTLNDEPFIKKARENLQILRTKLQLLE